ncbi:Arginine--tRNA ligase, chloroplastic/mitochondrial [Cardamine amara subsp. amara]|uniref:arginine--tRNA ligase n=1 Tax=Cardamine amara subsp. amara TaxID=228776 RepID=A0ABD1C718_CARAN
METAAEGEFGGNLKRQLEKLFIWAPDPNNALYLQLSLVASKGPNRKFGDYQCNDIVHRLLSLRVPGDYVEQIEKTVVENLPASEMVKSCSVTGPGFINVVISAEYMAKSIEKMLINGIDTWAPNLPVKRAVVDFYSPNIAEAIHVGHLRSPIIGDTLARLLDYSKVEVLRRNHVGDSGTQLGMLIEYLFENFPAVLTIQDLEVSYKLSKKKFDKDPDFKKKAQCAAVLLQNGDPVYFEAWARICEISRTESTKVIQRLQVKLEEKGQSFYIPYIPNMIEELTTKGLVEEMNGARVISIQDVKTPLTLVKKDGGFTYRTTDMAALWYRLNEEKAEWIIYVTDAGQREHFDKLFKAARKAGWLPANDTTYPRASHVGFGLVRGGEDGRFRSWYSKTVRLVSLLNEAKACSRMSLLKRGKDKEWTHEELDQTAEAVGDSLVKFADLKKNRLTSYTFSYDKMLCDKGKTAVYLLYAHARICSIIKKSGKDIDELKKAGKLALDHADERALGLHLLRFSETVEEACTKLLPHVLCEYLYGLSKQSSKFYKNCQVNGSAEETSRLLLCEATAIVIRKCFHLLGITPVYKL